MKIPQQTQRGQRAKGSGGHRRCGVAFLIHRGVNPGGGDAPGSSKPQTEPVQLVVFPGWSGPLAVFLVPLTGPDRVALVLLFDRCPFNQLSQTNTTGQNVESQAAGVTFQLPRERDVGQLTGQNAKRPKPEDWRAQALTCEVTSSAERETARAPTQRLDTLATKPVKPTQPTFLTQFSSEDREGGRRTRAPTQRLVLRWYKTRQQEHRIVHSSRVPAKELHVQRER